VDENTKRELQKVLDVLEVVERHFAFEAVSEWSRQHMAADVRPTPLAVAVAGACGTLRTVIGLAPVGWSA
jgi:hypothetical protein